MGRDLTAANIQWNQVMSNFEIQWKALIERKDEDDPDVPKITKALPIIKWAEVFQDFLDWVWGQDDPIGICDLNRSSSPRQCSTIGSQPATFN